MADPIFKQLARTQAFEVMGIPVTLQENSQFTGALEAGATFGTSVLSAIPAGLTGLGTLALTGNPEAAADVAQQVQQRFTYEPKTRLGSENVQAMAEKFRVLGAPAEAIGSSVLNVSDSPALATGAEMFLDPANLIFGGVGKAAKAGLKGMQNYSRAVDDMSNIFGEGAQSLRITDDASGGTMQILQRPDGTASILEILVPEESRGQGIGKQLQAQMIAENPLLQGQYSSRYAARQAYDLGMRPVTNPNATFDETLEIMKEYSSVNMGTPQFNQNRIGALTRRYAESQPFTTVDELYEIAPRAQAGLVNALTEASSDINGKVVNPDIKLRGTTDEKMIRKGYDDPRSLTDIVRAGFKIEDPAQATQMIKKLEKYGDVIDEGWNRTPEGYIDRKVLIKTPEGVVAEVQIWTPAMYEAKFTKGTELYTLWRSESNPAKRAEYAKQMQDLYAEALEKDQSLKSIFGMDKSP